MNKNIEKIKPDVLVTLMREVLDQSNEFIYINGIQPFFMSFQNKKYFVYVKNISSAYFSDRDKTTRAQLPIKPEFNSIKLSPYPFIFLGYDSLYDVFVCWNYHIAKERLNVGKSVSFYSRSFFQSQVKNGDFLRRELKNGDLPVIFKRSDLIEFFTKIESFFPVKSTLVFDNIKCIGNANYEIKFKNYLKEVKKLSDKSINNYSNALRSRISDGIRKYFISNLETVYLIENISILEQINIQLFKIEEFKNLDFKGKNMYSCALGNYITFLNYINNAKDMKNNHILNDVIEEYVVDGKLIKIKNEDLINKISQYIKSNRILSAAQIAGNFYKDRYPNMELSDWISLVRNIK